MSAGPKPFQQATAAAAIKALRGANPLRRFLVADEVGLGKTIVAREVLKALSPKTRKFKVYYISSGQKVANQNKGELLRSIDEDEAVNALSKIDRVGLVPFEEKHAKGLRLYAFTPQTSFSQIKRLSTGKAVERAFLKLLLDEIYPGLTSELPRGFIRQNATTGWASALREAQDKYEHATAAFKTAFRRALSSEFSKPARTKISEAANNTKITASYTIGLMRKALSQAALDSAPPDLVILDEFQCYRELLTAGPGNPLARQLLEGKNGVPPPTLLLSATPYRFYAERWETSSGTTPHDELFALIAFLGGADVRSEAEAQFREFGDLLHVIGRLPPQSREPAMYKAETIKHRLETLLTPLMSRTERSFRREDGEPLKPLRIEPHDFDVYRHFAAAVPKNLQTATIAYWLSVPLPAQALGDRYQITRNVNFPATRGIPRLTLKNWSKAPKDAWGSAKLRALGDLLPTEALALPWMLPSLTWWKPCGPWAKAEQTPKMLIFSRFKATPQSLAALVSLEVERRFGGRSPEYARAWKKRHLSPKPKQGPTLALFHPSPFLIRAVNPLDVRDGASLKQVRARARQQIIRALPESIGLEAPNKRDSRRRKPAWAILAAIEMAKDQPHAREFAAIQKAWEWVASKDATLQALVKLRQRVEPITWISKWELDALVDMALGGPGVVVGRALRRHLPELFDYKRGHYRKLLRFCWTKLRTYLDRPVFWSVLPGEDAATRYQNACIDGCLEAVLDEHFWLRKSKVGGIGLIEDLSSALSANVGTFGFKGQGENNKIRIRCHAAVPFGGEEKETRRKGRRNDEDGPARSEEIRSAFNTPFWPYVLATTSVGQEGLDFHSWCDRLGHWDLCSSPVDLEQREGRVQRFGGLTVRRPLAEKLGKDAMAVARRDRISPWDALKASANEAFKDDETGLTPWWTLPGANLKRHIFALPQSRDIDRFARLKKQRLLYRVALGQPDPEDLVELLSGDDPEAMRLLQSLTLNLSAFAHSNNT